MGRDNAVGAYLSGVTVLILIQFRILGYCLIFSRIKPEQSVSVALCEGNSRIFTQDRKRKRYVSTIC